jgi:hypothetical protein
MTLPTSRRAFLMRSAPVAAAVVLAGGTTAVAAAVASPVAATPATPPPVVDPIFALIEKHKAAVQEQDRTHEIFQQYDSPPRDDDTSRGVIVGTTPVRKRETVTADENEFHVRWLLSGETEPIVVYNKKYLSQYVPSGLSEADQAAWIADKTKELRRNRRAYNRRLKKDPRSIAYDAWNEADKVTNALSEQLIERPPMTVAGVIAVMMHWSEVMSENQYDRDFISTQELLRNLAKSVGDLKA